MTELKVILPDSLARGTGVSVQRQGRGAGEDCTDERSADSGRGGRSSQVRARAKPRNARLERQLQAIEKLEPTEKRQILQVLDTLIESAQFKRHMRTKQPA